MSFEEPGDPLGMRKLYELGELENYQTSVGLHRRTRRNVENWETRGNLEDKKLDVTTRTWRTSE